MLGINVWQYEGINYTPTNFFADYTIIINAAIAKGWSATNIAVTFLPILILQVWYQWAKRRPDDRGKSAGF